VEVCEVESEGVKVSDVRVNSCEFELKGVGRPRLEVAFSSEPWSQSHAGGWVGRVEGLIIFRPQVRRLNVDLETHIWLPFGRD